MMYVLCARAVTVRQPVLMAVIIPTTQAETGADIPTVVFEAAARQIVDVVSTPCYVVW